MLQKVTTTHVFRIKLKSLKEEICIHPIGDIHYDSELSDRKKFLADLHSIPLDRNNYIIGMGDYLDFLSQSDMKKIKQACMHESSMNILNRFSMGDLYNFYRLLSPYKKQIIGLLAGNHEYYDDHNISVTEKLSNKLGVKYLGGLSYIRLLFNAPNERVISVDIVACHGKSSGKLLGSKINNVRDLLSVYQNADIYLMGHDHSRGGMPSVTLVAVKSKVEDKLIIREKTQFFCRTGSYLMAYQDGQSSYASSRLLSPSSLGKITLKITFKRSKIDGVEFYEPRIKLET